MFLCPRLHYYKEEWLLLKRQIVLVLMLPNESIYSPEGGGGTPYIVKDGRRIFLGVEIVICIFLELFLLENSHFGRFFVEVWFRIIFKV